MIAEKIISNFVKKIEMLVSAKPALGEKYGKFFYGEMINNEIKLAAVSSGDKVAHLGCGPFPFTAFELARRGFEVEAIDCDERALIRARELAQYYNLTNLIKFSSGLCQEIDYSNFDAVWVSYNVRPGQQCLAQIVKTMGSKGKIIYREPRSWLKYFDNRIEARKFFSLPERGEKNNRSTVNAPLHKGFKGRNTSVDQKVGKKSVVIEIDS